MCILFVGLFRWMICIEFEGLGACDGKYATSINGITYRIKRTIVRSCGFSDDIACSSRKFGLRSFRQTIFMTFHRFHRWNRLKKLPENCQYRPAFQSSTFKNTRTFKMFTTNVNISVYFLEFLCELLLTLNFLYPYFSYSTFQWHSKIGIKQMKILCNFFFNK